VKGEEREKDVRRRHFLRRRGFGFERTRRSWCLVGRVRRRLKMNRRGIDREGDDSIQIPKLSAEETSRGYICKGQKSSNADLAGSSVRYYIGEGRKMNADEEKKNFVL
jgi:hypothetical protein